jgi:ParB-like chromosome segregation protein Spo0J
LTVEHVPVGDLRTYHRNPRRGNTTVIAQSLTINGQYRTLAVNRGTHTGRPNEVLAGNHTLIAARDLGWDTVAVTYVDVDDDVGDRIVAADNRTADLGEYDDQLLLELLADLPDLDGTGYDPGAIADLEKALTEPQFDPEGDDARLDRKSVTDCPSCGHTFTPTTRSITE